MGTVNLLSDIVFGVMGFVLTTFFLYWFNSVNKIQKEHDVKINDSIIKQIVNEKDNRIQDKDIADNKKQMQEAKKEFYKTSNALAKTMSELCYSQKENEIRITNVEKQLLSGNDKRNC